VNRNNSAVPDNVVPFDPSVRTALARRGAPDKAHAPLTDAVEVECVRCAAIVAVDLEVLYAERAVACRACGALIPLIGREWVEGTR
jgi:DNA-directed RNA polymerase subunit RPC12/RpoP